MNAVVLVAAMVAALNPPGRAVRVRHLDRGRGAVAAAVVVAVVVALAAAAEPIRMAADVSAPNLRLAAGLVVAVAGAVDLVRRPEPAVDLPAGPLAAAVPVVFPVLLEPQVAMLALAAGADRGLLAPGAAALAAVALWWGAASLPTGLLRPLARLIGAVGVLAGTALVVDGVLSV